MLIPKLPREPNLSPTRFLYGIWQNLLGNFTGKIPELPRNDPNVAPTPLLNAIWLATQNGGSGLPSQVGHAGEFLGTDGTTASWQPVAGAGDMLTATYDPAGVAAQLAGASGEAINVAAFRTALGGTAVGIASFTAATQVAGRAAIGAGTSDLVGSAGGFGGADFGKAALFGIAGNLEATGEILVTGVGESVSLSSAGWQFSNGVNTASTVYAALTANRTYTFPDATGTFALLERAQTFTALNKFTGGLESYRTDINQTRVGFNAAASDADTGYTAIGTRALGNTLNSGGSVTAVGRDAGSFSTGGQSGFFCHAAGYKAYNSSYCFAGGYLALANWADNPACDVEETVSLGHSSLQYAVTGRYAVAVGAYAGGGITTVTTTRSVSVGFNAGNLPGDFTIARSVFLGNLAGATIANGANRLVIETQDAIAPTGTGALIYGEFDNRLIRFGATNIELGGGAAQPTLKFFEASANGAHYAALVAPASIAATFDLILPIAPGTNGQAMTWTTGGQLAFATIASGVALGDTPTWTGAHTWSKNSAVSVPAMTATGTWITGGSATTNKPHVLIETAGATSTGWSTAGTGFGINSASGFVGLLSDMQVNGTSRIQHNYTGKLGIRGSTAAFNAHTFFEFGSEALGSSSAFNTLIQGGASGASGYFAVYRADGTFIMATNTAQFGVAGSLAVGCGSLTNTYDTILFRKSAAVLQLGLDAAPVTNQMFTAANRITSDGVGANLTIAPGNGRGGAGGNLILSTFTTAGAATIGTLTTRWTLDAATGHFLPGADVTYNIGSATLTPNAIFSAAYFDAGGLQVVSSQQPAVADCVAPVNFTGADSVDRAAIETFCAEVQTQFNTLLNRLRATSGHGLFAA